MIYDIIIIVNKKERNINMNFEQLVNQKEQELIQDNLIDLRENLFDKDYQLKIKNHCQKFNLSVSIINEMIRDSDITASFFIKDPSKQNFTEKLVSDLLHSKILPQSGKNCVRFDSDGNIHSLKKPDSSKSVDFYIKNTYITQKYTRGDGGAQDNQYKDVVDFLSKGSQQHSVAAILDG